MKNLISMLLSIMAIVAVDATEQNKDQTESVNKAQTLGQQVQRDIQNLRQPAETLKQDPSSTEAKEQGNAAWEKTKSDFQQLEQAMSEAQQKVDTQQNAGT